MRDATKRAPFGAALAASLVALWPAFAAAGGGPLNVLLVVNARSDGSKEVANHYVRLRNLPPGNVLYLDYDGPLETIEGSAFRERILRPILEAIDRRGLAAQIDTVAYSTDFPWRVDFRKGFEGKAKFNASNRPMASLTGATYLYGFVMADSPGLVSMGANYYVPRATGAPASLNSRACRNAAGAPSRAFRSRYAWRPDGTRAPDLKQGVRYLMATMLGVTTGRGLTVDEVVASLERAVESDTQPPTGAFYFMRRPGMPRSKPRDACFPGVVSELKKLGAEAYVENGSTPRAPARVAGLMMGDAAPTISAGVRVEAGAICEHLTSFGGDLRQAASQTPLTDLIRAGAAGASGTVWEPLAIQAKFPLPSLQLHYRRGCSLAESFYQSVAGPYQLLIVGDPLCQPWASRPGLSVAGWPQDEAEGELRPGLVSTFGFAELGLTAPPKSPEPAEQPEGGALLTLTPEVTPTGAGARRIAPWELYLDGKLRSRLPSGESASLNAEQLGPGWRRLDCVAINPDPIESQRVQTGGIEVLQTADGPIEPVRLTPDAGRFPHGGRVAVSATAPGAERIEIRHNGRVVGEIEGERGGALIDAALLGRGPIRLQAVALPSGAASPEAWTRVE